jgi:putative Holliday junction resolvase
MRYLAIDYGRKRTGLAISDPTETIVSPLDVIKDEKELCIKVQQLIKTEKIGAIVLGLPLNMDGSIGPQAKTVKKFAKRLKKQIKIPVYFQDERLSSFAAEEEIAEIQIAKKAKKEKLDAIAAAHILELYLERKKTR